MFYRDANGLDHESYEAACHYYGADTPAMLAAEAEAEADEWLDHCCDHGLFLTTVYEDDGWMGPTDREMEVALYGRGRVTVMAYGPNAGERIWNDGEYDAPPPDEPLVYRTPGCLCSDRQLMLVGCECRD